MTEDEEFSLLEHRIKRLEQMRGKLQAMPNEAAKETNMYPPLNDVNNAANDRQEGGSHYKGKAIQPWDYIISNELGYLEGNVVKYVSRYKEKNGLEDLKKARHYLDKLIEVIAQKGG